MPGHPPRRTAYRIPFIDLLRCWTSAYQMEACDPPNESTLTCPNGQVIVWEHIRGRGPAPLSLWHTRAYRMMRIRTLLRCLCVLAALVCELAAVTSAQDVGSRVRLVNVHQGMMLVNIARRHKDQVK